MSMMYGIGTKNIGRDNYLIVGDNQDEEFDTTLWFVLFFIPIIPFKSYRIRQQWSNRKDIDYTGYTIGRRYSFYILRNHPLNWVQILKTYLSIYGTIIMFFIFTKYFMNHG